MDDYLPCLAKTGYAQFDIEIFQKVLPSGSLLYGPIFTHSAQNDLWVCLLEKGTLIDININQFNHINIVLQATLS